MHVLGSCTPGRPSRHAGDGQTNVSAAYKFLLTRCLRAVLHVVVGKWKPIPRPAAYCRPSNLYSSSICAVGRRYIRTVHSLSLKGFICGLRHGIHQPTHVYNWDRSPRFEVFPPCQRKWPVTIQVSSGPCTVYETLRTPVLHDVV